MTFGATVAIAFAWATLAPASAVAQADLSITKSDSADPVATGSEFTYTLEVANAGPEAATSVVVEDELPNRVSFISASASSSYSEGSCALQGSRRVRCTVPTLPSGQSAVFTISVRAERDGTVTNTAPVSSATNDPQPANNSDSEQTMIQDPAAPAGAACAGREATIIGSAGADVLQGTDKRDVIAARAGDDVVRSGAGKDIVCTGAGNDRLRGQGSGDTLRGGSGDDKVRGGAGADLLSGNGGSDMLGGGPGDDILRGGPGPDVCRGGSGADTKRGC